MVVTPFGGWCDFEKLLVSVCLPKRTGKLGKCRNLCYFGVMKLIERLAYEASLKSPDIDDHGVFETAYMEGFRAAREMAAKLHSSKRVNDCFTDSEEFLQMGENEVDG